MRRPAARDGSAASPPRARAGGLLTVQTAVWLGVLLLPLMALCIDMPWGLLARSHLNGATRAAAQAVATYCTDLDHLQQTGEAQLGSSCRSGHSPAALSRDIITDWEFARVTTLSVNTWAETRPCHNPYLENRCFDVVVQAVSVYASWFVGPIAIQAQSRSQLQATRGRPSS